MAPLEPPSEVAEEPKFQIPLIAWFYAVALIGLGIAAMGGVAGLIVSGSVLLIWLLPTQGFSLIEKTVVNVIVLGLVGLLLPGLESRPRGSRRHDCQNNLKQLGLALHTYHSTYGSFPPAYVAGPDGKPWHSWRVLILPYLEGAATYAKYRFDEPWDGPNNRLLAAEMPPELACPAHDDAARNQTSYFAVVGPRTMWPGEKATRIDDIRDGTSDTLAIIEYSGRKVSWMEPVDLSEEEVVRYLSREDVPDVAHPGAACAAIADGSVQSCAFRHDPEVVASRCNIDDGFVLPPKAGIFPPRPPPFDWPRWLRPVLFVLLAFLPLPWMWRQGLGAADPPATPSATVRSSAGP